MKKLTHYKDTTTGRYVEKATWKRSRAHGGTRYKRTYERYVKPTGPRKQREGTPKGPLPQGETVERLEFETGKKRKFYQLEIYSKNGKIVSVRVNRKTYTQRASIFMLRTLIQAARDGGREFTRSARRK